MAEYEYLIQKIKNKEKIFKINLNNSQEKSKGSPTSLQNITKRILTDFKDKVN